MTSPVDTTILPSAHAVLDFWLADGLRNWPPRLPLARASGVALPLASGTGAVSARGGPAPGSLTPTLGTGVSSLPPEGAVPAWGGPAPTPGWPSQNLSQRWFGGGPQLDSQIKTQFGALVAQAVGGGLQDWENTPDQPLNRLALVILLDQFTRNVFRGSGRAFAGDARAQQLVRKSLALHWDQQLPWVGRVFLYMPLMHAEDLALQDECVRCFTRLHAEAPQALKARLAGHLDYAHQHRDIIARFGRFPYRNAALGRISTAQEEAFLQDGLRFGQ